MTTSKITSDNTMMAPSSIAMAAAPNAKTAGANTPGAQSATKSATSLTGNIANKAQKRQQTMLGIQLRRKIQVLVNGFSHGKQASHKKATAIRVRFAGTKAFTNGREVNIPRMPDLAQLDHTLARSLIGYAGHESAHIMYTDFGVLQTTRELPELKADKVLQKLTMEIGNAIEDYRIERELTLHWPGTKNDLTILRNKIHPKDDNLKPEFFANPVISGALALTWTGCQLNTMNVVGVMQTLSLFPTEVRALINDWTKRMDGVPTTTAVYVLALEFAKEAIEFVKNQMQQHAQSQPQSPTQPDQPEDPADQGQKSPDDQNPGDQNPGDQNPDNQNPGNENPDNENPDDENSDTSDKKDPDANAGSQNNDQDEPTNADQSKSDSQPQPESEKEPNQPKGYNSQPSANKPGQQANDGQPSKPSNGQPQPVGEQNAQSPSSLSPDANDNDPADEDSDAETDLRKALADALEQIFEENDISQGEINVNDVIDEILERVEKAPDYDTSDEEQQHSGNAADDGEPGRGAGSGVYNTRQFLDVEVSDNAAEVAANIKSKCGPTISATTRIIRRKLKSIEQKHVVRGKMSGDFDITNISDIVRNTGNVYKTTSVRKAPTTRVAILVDFSGSMSGAPIGLAMASTLAFEAATMGTSIETSIHGYTCSYNNSVALHNFKKGSENRNLVMRRIGSYEKVQMGSTPTGEAMTAMISILDESDAQRKVMLVVTDGQANDMELCRQVVEIASRRGIEIVAIGINSHSVKYWAHNAEVIHKIEDLPNALLAAIDIKPNKKRKAA